MNAKQAKEAVSNVATALEAIDGNANLLDGIAWPLEVEERFFADGATKLPSFDYAVDRDGLEKEIAELRAVERSIDGDGAIPAWLRATVASYRDRARLLLAVGTRDFGRLSVEIYGSARSSFFGLDVCNLDLARHLEERFTMHGWDAAKDTEDEPLDAKQMAEFLEVRIEKHGAPIKVVLDPKCTSKAIAGMKRVRIRPDATFTAWEAEGLYRHEIETHAYSALNGAEQPHAGFLKSGGPRSTPTQEGLAVFAELYHHALAVPRLERLGRRVETVAMAEDGASFLDVYRYLTETHGMPARDAYLDTVRIFRGGLPEGGAAFTKDACYLAGLVDVHAFLATFVRAGFRDECEMLICGRFALEDIAALVELRALGVLSRPKWRPRWLREWGTLLPYFAFTSFLDDVDLAPVEARYADAIRIASAATTRPSRSKRAS